MRKFVDKPSPITGGKLELCSEIQSVEYRGETIRYEKVFYHCIDTDMEFCDEQQEAANLKCIYDTYRHNHFIPTAEELKAARERYCIPATAMSSILGLGENQYGQYEEGVVPVLSVGRLLSMAMNPQLFMDMLRSSRHSFSEKQYVKYYDAVEKSLHPANYIVEKQRVIDFDTIRDFLPARTERCSSKTIASRKIKYSEYNYAICNCC